MCGLLVADGYDERNEAMNLEERTHEGKEKKKERATTVKNLKWIYSHETRFMNFPPRLEKIA